MIRVIVVDQAYSLLTIDTFGEVTMQECVLLV
jgi:hypothetical protein